MRKISSIGLMLRKGPQLSAGNDGYREGERTPSGRFLGPNTKCRTRRELPMTLVDDA